MRSVNNYAARCSSCLFFFVAACSGNVYFCNIAFHCLARGLWYYRCITNVLLQHLFFWTYSGWQWEHFPNAIYHSHCVDMTFSSVVYCSCVDFWNLHLMLCVLECSTIWLMCNISNVDISCRKSLVGQIAALLAKCVYIHYACIQSDENACNHFNVSGLELWVHNVFNIPNMDSIRIVKNYAFYIIHILSWSCLI